METTVKILVIRFSSIGDIVLTTPVIRCLKEQLEGDVVIDVLTKQQYVSFLTPNPNINKVHTITKSTNEIIKDLQAVNYDYVVDLHKNLRSKRVVKALKQLTFTFDKLNFKKWLLTTFKINKLPNVHIVDRYLAAVKALGVVNDNKGLAFYIPNKDVVDLNTLPTNFANGYITFAIGAQHATKRLPNHKIISICNKINHPIVLLGGREDAENAKVIMAGVKGEVYNACGKYSINQSASLIQQSKHLITHDTGLMHIAAALNTPITSVWGNTVPAFGMYPYMPNNKNRYTIIENKQLSCRPCSKIGYNKCPKRHFKCMEEIDEAKVIASLSK